MVFRRFVQPGSERVMAIPFFRRPKAVILLGAVIVVVGYVCWSRAGRSVEKAPPDLRLAYARAFGIRSTAGNIVAIQPYMVARDYASRETLLAKLDAYFREVERRGWLNSKSAVVLPEYLGVWLVAAGEKRGVYDAPTTDQALRLLVLSNLFSVARPIVSAPCTDRLKYAVFRMKAESMAKIYDSVLSDLARRYRVTIVGGSIVLPSPSVVRGRLRAGTGPLYNVSAVYLPNGAASENLVTKTFLTADENTWLKGGDVGDLPVFNTPSGKVGVLICADSWFPDSYRVLKRKNAEVIAVVSYIAGNRTLQNVWQGYSGQAAPADVRSADIGKISSAQAWMRYALAGRQAKSGMPMGIMVCLRGVLWDLGSDGSTVIVRNGRAQVAPVVDGAAIVNLWLPPH